jgi:hypothetical protein
MATITITRPVAEDGVQREPSNDPDVHRPLIVVDPPMLGRDVANLQRAVEKRLRDRGLADDVPVPTHGKFTLATALACIEAEYWLGLRSATYLLKDVHGHRVVTEGAQRILREPDTRDDLQRDRARVRRVHLREGPRVIPGLVPGIGVEAAIAFAIDHIGVKESPLGSDSGPKIDDWCDLTGYNGPVPWCGCFVNACIIAGGVANGKTFGIGYTPSILSQAKNNKDGWSFHMTGKRGDLALLDSAGGAPVEHVEIVVKRVSNTQYETIGGNTSAPGGNQSQGTMVAKKMRSTSGGFRIIGFARPPY